MGLTGDEGTFLDDIKVLYGLSNFRLCSRLRFVETCGKVDLSPGSKFLEFREHKVVDVQPQERQSNQRLDLIKPTA